MRDVTFSHVITPSHTPVINQKCLAFLWMLTLFLRCDSTTETLNLTVLESRQGVDISRKLARGKEAGCFCEVAGVSIVAVGGLCSQ